MMKHQLSLTSLLLTATMASTAFAKPAEVYIQPIASHFPTIELNVNVRDAEGTPIQGLTEADFSLIEDLNGVSISSFEEIVTEGSTNNKVDVVFVFDDTGSMADEIEALKNKTIEFANIIQSSGFDFNLGLISYKDEIYKPYRVTDNAATFKDWVSDLVAAGGDDEPENALDAIYNAANQSFREDAEKIFILITDATFQASNSHTPLTMHDVIAELKEHDIRFHAVGPNIDQYKVMTAELNGTYYDKDSGQFNRIITQIAGGSSNNYRLTFASERPDNDFTWRAIELLISGYEVKNNVTQYQAPSWVTASSRKDALAGSNSQYSPHFVVDGIASTAWVEGVSGSGEGEWLALNFAEPELVSRFEINAGDGVTLPSTVGIKVNGESARRFKVDADGKKISGSFETDLEVSEFKIVIESSSGSETGFGDIVLLGGKPEKVIAPIAAAREERLSVSIALDLNKKGEALYHEKKYDDAIYYYKEAIAKRPSFAQAYSNLGLAYQRVNDYPNAIWANRKAIALARGNTKNVVSASSYYNIARIFEAQNKHEEALQNFYWAKSFRSHSAYDNGIARMKAELGL